jgi:low affinity Fe/Cu permease
VSVKEPSAPDAEGFTARSSPNDLFRKFSHKTSQIVGSPWTFIGALVVILGWAASGPIFGFSDTWQLVINTGTTIVTFLIVFLIQNTQNRDAKALHLKLDELISSNRDARNKLLDLEDMSDEELTRFEDEFRKLRSQPDRQRREQEDVPPESPPRSAPDGGSRFRERRERPSRRS